MKHEWSVGNQVGRIYRLTEKDNSRVGDNWMAGRLRDGDLALCVRHSGDGFYQYILLEVGDDYIKGIPESSFGSYAFSHEPIPFQTNLEENNALIKGKSIKMNEKYMEWTGWKGCHVLKPIEGLSKMNKQDEIWIVFTTDDTQYHATMEIAEEVAKDLAARYSHASFYVAKAFTEFTNIVQRIELV